MEEDEIFLRKDRRFLTFLTDDEAKKERMPKRPFREMLMSEESVDEDEDEADEEDDEEEEDVLESARVRRCDHEDDTGAGEAWAAGTAAAVAAAAAAAATSCSLERRGSGRRRRERSRLRRRGSRIILDGGKKTCRSLHGPFMGAAVECSLWVSTRCATESQFGGGCGMSGDVAWSVQP